MSHLARIEIEIKDLETLKTACKSLGIEFMQDQRTYAWYSGAGKCDHAIRVPNASYEIGVVRQGSGNGYDLVWDNYYAGGLEEHLGRSAGKLKQAYAVERVRKEARIKGYKICEQKSVQGTRLVLTV